MSPVKAGAAQGLLDPSWNGWLQENLERGCDRAELAGILRDHGFTAAAIRGAMGDAFPASLSAQPAWAEDPDAPAGGEVRLVREADQLQARRAPCDKAEVFVMDDFLSPDECDHVLRTIVDRLRPSTVTIPSPADFRTSRTSDLSLVDDPRIIALDGRIAQTLGVNLAYSEGIQGQHYEPGQQFKAHTDYFEPGTEEYRENCLQLGNRTWTFMVYLNDVARGGQTHFPQLDFTVTPRRGRAVIWNNLRADGSVNPNTLHAGVPVEAGSKTIITKWFRQHSR